MDEALGHAPADQRRFGGDGLAGDGIVAVTFGHNLTIVVYNCGKRHAETFVVVRVEMLIEPPGNVHGGEDSQFSEAACIPRLFRPSR